MEEKKHLRMRMKERLAELTEEEKRRFSDAIALRVSRLPGYPAARRVLCYWGTSLEVRTDEIIRQMLADGKEVYLPVVRGHGKMDAARLLRIEDVRAGAYGIPEPVSGELIAPALLDWVLAPGVAFDEWGNRLGHGAGYYDRFLPLCPRALVVGLSYEAQLVGRVPVEETDRRMDVLLTESQEIFLRGTKQ